MAVPVARGGGGDEWQVVTNGTSLSEEPSANIQQLVMARRRAHDRL